MNSLIKTFKHKLKRAVGPRYYIVYKNHDGKIKTYQVGNIDLYNSFGNKRHERNNVGFKAYCFGRKQIRSFRHDRIVSITKK